jgi:uncharacterized delta-60 repeat protein
MKQLFCLFCACLSAATLSFAQNVMLDPSFSGDGMQALNFYTFLDYGRNIDADQNGNIWVSGFNINLSQDTLIVKRILPDGTEDPTFKINQNYFPDCNGLNALQLQEDGNVIICSGRHINRLSHTGAMDTTFGVNGFASLNGTVVNEIAVRPDGKIAAGGYDLNALTPNARKGSNIWLYNADGSLDTTFADRGAYTHYFPTYNLLKSVRALPDNKLIGAGITGGNFNWKIVVFRLHPNGQLDSSFAEIGYLHHQITGSSEAYGLDIQKDGKIVISGYTWNPYRGIVMRFNPNGTIDSSFAENGVCSLPSTSEIMDVIVKEDGKIIGIAWLDASVKKAMFLQLTADGHPDPDFGDNGIFELPVIGAGLPMCMTQTAENKFVGCISSSSFRGLVQIITDANVGVLNPEIETKSIFLFPNPVRDRFNVRFSLPTPQSLSAELYDASGRLVKTYYNTQPFSAGEHELSESMPEGLATGSYYLKISAGGRLMSTVAIVKK